ncbi:RHS repeat-associated core domain [Chryseobacterium nakagawai]|uniref:RHS repeat-associated core domain-containing protein n=1 Tax=Chryseobacterium nakagawai TaxID=1241982 RepID=A0AAD0YRK9_CHRNA|nr:DUF6443 domain-containing protein [Chryseobacterium nakagawai]AZA93474.1 RHS repeat-associated core domain-containing protein [Chryseobacterium nakagawai]VEH20159.1 RHS repeat-associated core domain [Chryseobacterium nakagawai]
MKNRILFLILLLPVLSKAQNLTQSENYIYSRTYMEAVTSEQAGAAQIQTVQYVDGLGRPVQNIAIKASPSAKDIVVPITYDSSGRPDKSYLPLPADSQNGAYLSGINGNTINTYYGVSNAYSEVAYEKSPWGRPEKQAMPGTEWQISGTHTQKMEYAINTDGQVRRFRAETVWNPSTGIYDVSLALGADDAYTSGGYYKAGTLFKSISKDGDGNEIQTFISSRGQTLLLRKINTKIGGSSENLDTYYVYSESGNIVFIIPPKAAILTISQAVLDNLCYQYKYDQYNRLVEKKIPGKGWEYMVYDKQDRVVLSQDALLAGTSNTFGKKGWLFTKYDAFDRPLYNGFFSSAASRTAMQTALNNMSANALNNERPSITPFVLNNINIYYTKEAFPTGSMTVLGINYYDEYPAGIPEKPQQIQGNNTLSAVPSNITINGLSSIRTTKAFPTASFIRNIENDRWTSSALWYDTLGRVIGTYEGNHLGGFTRTESLLDFSGKAKESYTFHSKNTDIMQVTVKDRFIYNPQNFLLRHYQQIDSKPEELLSEYTYNDLGRVTNKKTGGALQSIDYSYNIRGWLTGINAADINSLGSKFFAYKIKYNTVEGAEIPNNSYSDLKVKPKYNGSIAEVDWKTAYGSNEPLRRYGYVYDGTDRLLAGFFQAGTNPYSKEYSEILNYDLNGNITNLTRTGSAVNGIAEVMDDLKYIYLTGGNLLNNVQETGKGNLWSGYPLAMGKGSSIQYDGNGNITQHLDKGQEKIIYNFLNLPSQILTSYPTNAEKYIYSSDGSKVQMTRDVAVTDYLGAFQYTTNSSTGTQTSFVLANEEGYYDFVNSRYVYQYSDHLGNIRLSYTRVASGQPVILEENNYYPFGLKHTGYNTGDTSNNKFKYLYNGKELQGTGNLDYGWRQYMPDLGRWNGIDQLAENYHATSPYAYVMNNPLSFTDPDGRQINREERGWSFSGEDIGWAMSYFQNGGSLKALDNALESWNAGGGSFEGNNDNFWTKFEGLNLSLPPVTLTGKIGAVWALQLRNHVNAYMEQWNGQYSARFFEDRVGDQVLPPKKTALGKFWSFISPRIWTEGGLSYNVNYEGVATGIAPITGDVPLNGPGLKGLIQAEKNLASGLVEDLITVRHHTSLSGLKGIKNSGSINASRGIPYGVDVEIAPFVKATKAKFGQAGTGSYIEFSVPKNLVGPPAPGYMGGTGTAGRIVTNGAPFELTGTAPKFIRWNWLGF